MRRFLAGSLIGVVVAAVVAGSVYSATSLLYISGTLTSGHTLVATSDGFGAQDSGYSADRTLTLTWGPGQNLATNTLPLLSLGPTAATAVSTACTIGSVPVTGTATISLNFAASGTALAAGTNIINASGTPCNAAGTANTTQAMGLGTTAIPGNSVIGVVATGAGWTSSAGSGVIQVRIQQ